jgi:hypothetical protein
VSTALSRSFPISTSRCSDVGFPTTMWGGSDAAHKICLQENAEIRKPVQSTGLGAW